MKHVLLSTVCLLVFASGCSLYHVMSEYTTEDFYPAKETSAEIVYMETVNRPHEVIAVVTVNAERHQLNMENVIAKMKREAAILGGDAITDLRSDATGVWKRLPVQKTIGNAYVRANFTASVVVFK